MAMAAIQVPPLPICRRWTCRNGAIHEAPCLLRLLSQPRLIITSVCFLALWVHGSFRLQEWRAALDGFIHIRSSRSSSSSSSNRQNLVVMRVKLQNTADSIPSFPSVHRRIRVPPSGPSAGGNRGRKRFMM